MALPVLRYPDALAPTAAALGFVAAGYAGGIALMALGGWPGWLPGALLTAQAMVIAAYMIHECAHTAVFRETRHNARLGRLLMWVTGACYGDYEDVREKHMRHHVDRGDVIFLDYRPILQRHGWLRRLIEALEWAWIPAMDLFMHALMFVLPFTTAQYRRLRARVLAVALLRGTAFGLLAWFAWPAALGYALAYCLMLVVLRFMDMHQHTYEVMVTLGTGRKGPPEGFDRDYEHRNTFSNPMGRGLFNLITLNFGYHNAHHVRPAEPWYRLPALDRSLFSGDDGQVLPFANVLRCYGRHRVRRVMNEDHGDMGVGSGPHKGLDFVGVYGVSFLTAY